VINLNIDITKLKSGIEEYTLIDLDYSFSKEELEGTNIIELNDVKINGYITKSMDNFHLKLDVKGTMVLPCSISLKPTNYDFNIEIDDDFDEIVQENLKNVSNSIDIFQIIWENILMEIPLRVVNSDLSDVKTKGEGWQFVTDKEERINPALEKLKDLL